MLGMGSLWQAGFTGLVFGLAVDVVLLSVTYGALKVRGY